MFVSALVATYRRPESLVQCLRSLLRQTRIPDEIVVVYEADDPGSANAAAKVLGDTSLLVLAESSERRIAAAENIALANARGDIVWFVDDDVVVDPNCLERMLQHFADPTVGGVGGQDVIYVPGQPSPLPDQYAAGRFLWYGKKIPCRSPNGQPMEAHSLKGCCMAFRRRLFDTIDSRLKGTITYRWEDDVCFAVCRNGGRLIYDPTLRVDHFPTKPADHFDDPEVLYISNHNTIYLMLKHNSAFRGGLFLSYSFLLGDYDAYGLAAFLREWLRRKDASFWHQFVPTFSGKIAGLWSFWGGGVRKRRVA